tara:strand:+ start:166 stop:366 length:201 start_codon:yes stop_codon:yes gene_type:complete
MVSTATIKLTKAEIDSVIRALALLIKVSDFFNFQSEEDEIPSFVRLKDDFLKIKRQLDEGEQQTHE